MKSHNVHALAAAAGLAVALAEPASASVNVRIDQNTIMDLRGAAGTVLIGDPAVADVSLITPRRIAILGRGYGQTNVVITDRMGRVIFNQEVQVTPVTGNRVSVYRGALVSNFTCTPTCERTPAPGEDKSVYDQFAGSYKDHSQGAQSSAGGGGGAPGAPAAVPQ